MALEVFGGGPGDLSPFAFQSVGSLLGLDTDVQLKSAFTSYPANGTGSIATLKIFGEGSGAGPEPPGRRVTARRRRTPGG
jgi:alpha-amylase